MTKTASQPTNTSTMLALLVLAVGLLIPIPAVAKPAPPSVAVGPASASLNTAGACVHEAVFEVSGAKGKWASYQAEQSFDGGSAWFPIEDVPARVDIKADSTITVDRVNPGELALRLRLVKRGAPITDWAEALPTSCD
jgi:hypothetical protein